MDSLPLHILQVILSRLCTKTLFQLRSVCRLLRDVVDDPSFLSVHLSNIAAVEPPRILVLSLPRSLSNPKEPGQLVVDDKFVFSRPGSHELSAWYKPQGSCHGLLCLEHLWHDLVLFNPILKETVLVPKPNSCMHRFVLPPVSPSLMSGWPKGAECAHRFGIGLHPVTHKYKIMHVGWHKKGLKFVSQAEVLDQGSRSWRKIDSLVPLHFFSWARDPVYADGSIHWLVGDHIVSFRVAAEEFVSTSLPSGRDPKLFKRLIDLGSRGCGWGLVGSVERNPCKFDVFHIYIWMLNDGQWIRKYRINLYNASRVYAPPYQFDVVGCCGKDGNFILQHEFSSTRSLFCYESLYHTIKHEIDLPRHNRHLLPFYYYNSILKVSLVSPVKLWNIENY